MNLKNHQAVNMDLPNETISKFLSNRDESAFEQVFKSHFKNLHAYAFTILNDEDEAEEMVEQVFNKLWDGTESLPIEEPATAYLYRQLHNVSLNYIKHQRVVANRKLHVAYSIRNESNTTLKKVLSTELQTRLQLALNELPEQCRTIFQMSRFDKLKYQEIASKLDISIKIVENQMGKAMKILRTQLIEFLPILILLLKVIF